MRDKISGKRQKLKPWPLFCFFCVYFFALEF